MPACRWPLQPAQMPGPESRCRATTPPLSPSASGLAGPRLPIRPCPGPCCRSRRPGERRPSALGVSAARRSLSDREVVLWGADGGHRQTAPPAVGPWCWVGDHPSLAPTLCCLSAGPTRLGRTWPSEGPRGAMAARAVSQCHQPGLTCALSQHGDQRHYLPLLHVMHVVRGPPDRRQPGRRFALRAGTGVGPCGGGRRGHPGPWPVGAAAIRVARRHVAVLLSERGRGNARPAPSDAPTLSPSPLCAARRSTSGYGGNIPHNEPQWRHMSVQGMSRRTLYSITRRLSGMIGEGASGARAALAGGDRRRRDAARRSGRAWHRLLACRGAVWGLPADSREEVVGDAKGILRSDVETHGCDGDLPGLHGGDVGAVGAV